MDSDDDRLFSDIGTPPPPPPPPSPPLVAEDIFPTDYVASVNDLEDSMDQMLLSVFETMRCDPNENNSHDKAEEILRIYYKMLFQVDHLIGINVSGEEIEQKTFQMSEDFRDTRQRIIAIEDELKEMKQSVHEKLSMELSDDYLGLAPNL